MTTLQLLFLVPLIAALVIAAAIDGSTRRIPNWLVLPLLAAGIVQSFFGGHLVSPMYSLLGFLVGFGLTFAMFGLNAMGGGDVKLLAAVGAWVGPEMVLYIFAVEAVLGMLIVLTQAAYQGRLRVLARNTAVVAMSFAHASETGLDQATQNSQTCRSVDRPLPFAVPVLFAALAVLAISWRGGLP